MTIEPAAVEITATPGTVTITHNTPGTLTPTAPTADLDATNTSSTLHAS